MAADPRDASRSHSCERGAWELLDEPGDGGLAAQVEVEASLLDEVHRGVRAPTARIWQPGRGIAVTRADARLPHFANACATLAKSGWPVVVRDSGGGAVPHSAGVLCLSLFFAPPRLSSLEAVYDILCAPLTRALGGFGVAVTTGAVVGAFCDGRFNLTAGTRKIVGTAQRWRARPGARRGAVLAHASWLIDLDLAEATAALNRFHAEAGSDVRFRADACTTLRAQLRQRSDARAEASSTALLAQARAGLIEALAVDSAALLAFSDAEM